MESGKSDPAVVAPVDNATERPRASSSEALSSTLPAQGWQAIETAPKDAPFETRLRLFGAWKHRTYGWIFGRATYHVDKHHEAGGYWIAEGGEPTHWMLMPLPAPPASLPERQEP